MKARWTLLALPLVLAPLTAHAAKTATLKLSAGAPYEGEKYDENENGKDYAGAGAWQGITSWTQNPDKSVDIVTVYMSSVVKTQDRPWQGKCSVLRLKETGEPEMIVKDKQITTLGDKNNADERPFNRPHLVPVEGAKNKTKYFLLTYASDADNGNVQTYAQLMNNKCELMSGMQRISNDNNNNQGAPDAVQYRPGYVLAGYYDNNDRRTYAVPLMIDDTDPAKPKVTLTDTQKTIVTPSNIGRPTVDTAGKDRVLLCAAKGNNRPPEQGVECAYLALDGAGKLTIKWKNYIDESKPAQGIYYNQPTVRTMGPDTMAILTLKSNGKGKNTNDKGKTETTLSVVRLTDQGMEIKAKRQNVGLNQAHTGLCAGRFGKDGAVHAMVFDSPITGVGKPGAQIVSYDPVAKDIKVDSNANYFTVGWVGDSGRLANLYMQNPNQQGRDFMRCTGDIINPGYGKDGGWQNDAQTFVAFPHSGRIKKSMAEPKNALYLTLLPGYTKEVQKPSEPVDISMVPVSKLENPGGNGGPSDPPTGTGDNGGLVLHDPNASGGCTVGSRGHANGLLAAFAVLAMLGLARSKREA
jgi:hypothetical protein